jgi:hypothetical protein
VKELIFKRNDKGEIEAWDESNRTTLSLTFGECADMLRWFFDDTPPVFGFRTREEWAQSQRAALLELGKRNG